MSHTFNLMCKMIEEKLDFLKERLIKTSWQTIFHTLNSVSLPVDSCNPPFYE